ncbi:hypothetical protein BpHYR1_034454 [Brachionus plicatilis]|uniref:Uncharacterized protein n=1 Tax=Brachionus plicatilis TaxID=10195 RepID=A0A3M7SC06_BRAPC|nr:hypothetical protein BpHYR1_034454 [Brachionus plicatilis]
MNNELKKRYRVLSTPSGIVCFFLSKISEKKDDAFVFSFRIYFRSNNRILIVNQNVSSDGLCCKNMVINILWILFITNHPAIYFFLRFN